MTGRPRPSRRRTAGAAARVDLGFVLRRAIPVSILAWFVVYALDGIITSLEYPQYVFIDGRLYAAAAAAWLRGENPWASDVLGTAFAAPPPTLAFALPLVPFGQYGGHVAALVCATAAAVAVRRLGLPVWWVLWPPLFESILVANPDAVVLLLLSSSGAVGPHVAAVFAKLYAAIPLLVGRRWKSVLAVGAALAVSLPVLPWAWFLGSSATVSDVLREHSGGGLSAFGRWPVFLVAAGAVAALGRHGSLLVVPALWPYTQMHYAAMALPVASRSKVLTIALSVPIALAPPLGVVLFALWEREEVRQRLSRLLARLMPPERPLH